MPRKASVISTIAASLTAGMILASAAVAPAQAQEGKTIWVNATDPVLLGHKALRDGNPDKAIMLFERGLEEKLAGHRRVNALSDLCIAYNFTGQNDAALEACNEAIALNADYWRAYNNRANIYYDRGDYAAALADYEAAARLNPRSVAVRRNIDLVKPRVAVAQ